MILFSSLGGFLVIAIGGADMSVVIAVTTTVHPQFPVSSLIVMLWKTIS